MTLRRGSPVTAHAWRMSDRRHSGFTLIELMVVVVIVAILASIAAPGYRQHALRTQRAEAKSSLLGLAVAQEKFYLQNDRYAGSTELTGAPPAGLGIPATTEHGRYAIAVASGDVAGFSATATAQGAQADDARCLVFAIDHTGARTATSAGCWD